MAYNSKKRRETKKVKSQGGQVIHTGDVTSSGTVAPHRQREDSDLRRQSFRDLVQQESGIGGGMTSGYGGFHPVYLSDRKMDAQGAQGYISAKAEPGKQYIQQHPQQNWNPYAPKQQEPNPYAGGYVRSGDASSPEFNALAALAQKAGEARSKTYGEYMQDRRDALKRDQALNLPGFGMRYPSIAAQEYGRQQAGGELEEDRDYIRRKWAANQADPSDATRPGGVAEGDRIFKGRGVLARDDRTLQNALMTDEQRQTYYYIYGTQGREEAERFRQTVLDAGDQGGLNAQIAQRAYEVGGKHAEGIPRLIGNTAAGAVGAADRALDNIAGVKDVVTGNPQYRPTSTAGFYADTVQRDAPEGSAERMLYELSQTAATNAPAYLAGIAGGPAVGRTVFAIQAGASAYNESLKEGHTVGEATAYGAMQALDEEITGWLLGGLAGMSGGVAQKAIGRSAVGQMVSQTLQGLMQTEGGKYLMRQLMEAFGNGMGEAAQEYLQHFTEQFEQWIAYNHDNYTITTEEGRQNLAAAAPTLEEAKKALLDPQALHEALLGFLNAGLMNAPGQALEAADIASRGRNSTIGVQGYGEFADSIDVNPLHYSNPDTYQAARDLRGMANEYAARNTAGMPTSTFDRGIIDRAAEEFADRAAQDPRQLARTAYGPDAGEIENVAPEATREAEQAPPAEPAPETAEKIEPESVPEETRTESTTPATPAADIDAEINLRRQQAEQARDRQRRIAEGLDTPSYHAAEATETPTLEGLAQAAGAQQAATKGAQRQAIVDAAQNLDAGNLAGVMDNATMLTEAEKQAAYQEGKAAAVTRMRMEAQNGGEERAYVSGEGSERNVSLRTGERTGRVSQTAGRTAEGWKDWNRTADTGIHRSDIAVSAGISAEKVIRTAEPGQTVHVVERGGSPSMRKSAAMIRHYDRKMKVVPFVSRGDIRVNGGETARAFSDPLTRTIGYRANDENAPGEELTRHELIEFGIIDGKVNPAEAVRHLSDEVRKHTGGNIVGIVSELYARGSIANFDSLPAVQKAAALRHANKEMICDIGAGINQFRGIKGAESIAELVDTMSEILSPYMNEHLGGAFDAEAETSDSEALEDVGIIVNESGAVAHMGYSTRYSWKTDKEIEKAVNALQKSLGVSRAEAEAFVESERSLTNLILSPGNVAAMDYTPDDRYKAIKKNSDYPQGTVDFNNNCRKRIPFTSVFNRLQMRNPNRVFTAEDLEIIRQTLIKDNVAVACALCYVEERRQRLGEIAEGFVNLYSNGALLESFAGKREYNKLKAALEKVGDDSYQPNIYDLITYDGLKALDESHHGIAEAFRIYNNARGMQSGRLIEGRAEYKRELLKYTDDQVKRINDLGGLRIFSYSDFEAVNLLDLVQIIQDAAVRGIKIQAYTKVPAFARVVRNTGIKLNRSLIAAGNGVKYVDGKAELDLDPVEGIDINDPDFFDSTDDRDVGNVLVGMSDEQIRLAMASPLVDYIIPFHTSLPKTILKAKGIDHWTNYKLSQTDKDMKTGNNAKNINIYTDVLQAARNEGKPIRTKRQFVEKFLQVAKERNLIPRFSQFLNVDANGNYVYTEGYHKFLIDFKLFDKNGRIIEQEVVRPRFDDAYNTKLMEDFAKGAGTSAVTNGIYNDVVNALNEQSRGTEVQHSSKLNVQLDEEYMKAVNSGDTDRAREMVEKAAADAGFTNAIPEQTLAYKVRTGKAPQKTMKVYKVFTVAPDGAPTALFVSGTQKLPQGVWLDAQDTWHFTAANGEQYVPSTQNPYTEGGKTGGSVEIPSEEIRQELIKRGFLPEGSKAKKVTALAYRPGWHAGDLPFFPQGGMQDKAYAEKETEYGDIWKQIRKEEGVSENKAKRLRRERYGTFDEWRGSENVAAHPYKNIHRYNQVVFECEIAFDHDYTRSEVIQKNGENKGKVQFFDMQEMPVDGGYKFATNPMANANDIGSWYISGSLKIGRALTQEECDAILKENGRIPQFWEQGEMNLESLGYTGQQYEAARKTLAPVTYDDDGNVIPLSKRFDPEVDDVRYSSKLDLSDLEEEYQEALKTNNKDWQLQVVSSAAYRAGYTVGAYHGSPVENIHVFNTRGDGSKKQAKQLLFGTHFTQNLEYAKIYARKAKNSKGTSRMTSKEKQVYNVYLDLGKSLDLRTPQNITPGMEEYTLYEDAPAKYRKKYPPYTFSRHDTEQGLGSGRFITKATLENVLQAMPPSEATDFLTSHGYNSVLYDANYATPTSGNNRLTRDPSIIMLDPERIKSGDPITYDDNGNAIPLSERFNPANDDIRYSSKLNLTDAMLADLVTKYGALPKGENAKVNIELPKQTSATMNTRRFTRNVLESGVANAQASDAIKEMIIKEALSYEPKTDKNAAEYASSAIRAGGIERARREWDRAVKNGKIEKEDMALGQFLLKEYAKLGDTDKVLEMTEEISAIATRFGQNIQSLRLLKKYAMQDPAVGLGYIQRTVDQMNREAKRKMGSKYKEMKINPTLASEYINAKTSDQIDAALGKIYVNLGSQVQKTTGEEIADRLRAWRYLSMLGNSRTHIRNLVGNAIFVPAVRMKDAIGAELEKSTGASRTKALRATPESVAFAKKDAILMRDVLSGKTDMSIRDLIMEQRKVFSTNFLNKASKGNSELLEKEDWWFLRMHYVNALSKYITANNIDPNTIDGRDLSRAREYAIKEAQKATYRDANRFASWLNSGTKISEPAKFMIEGMMPFKKTPANILRRGVEYSPAGLIATATKGTLDLRAGKLDLNEYIDRLSAGLTGSAVFGLGMFLASTGLILGGYADDDDKTRRKLRGEQEYSVRIGDHTYTVDWAAPGSLPLFVGVETMCALMQQDITFSDIPEMTLRVIDPMINMSMLDGLNNTLEAISYSDHKLSAIVMENLYSLLGQFVPTIMGQGARIIDTTQRINYQDKNLGVSKDMLYFFEKIQNKIPFMSFKNDPYLNEFGQENVTESRFVAAFQNLVSPGYISKINDDKVIKELDRLSEAQEENVYPKKMDKYVGSGKDRKDLTSAEYTTYQRIAGQLSYNILDNMVDDKRYDSLTADQQAEAIKMAYSYAKAVGRIAIQKDYEEKLKGDNKKIYNAAKDNALQAYDVILDLVTK